MYEAKICHKVSREAKVLCALSTMTTREGRIGGSAEQAPCDMDPHRRTGTRFHHEETAHRFLWLGRGTRCERK